MKESIKAPEIARTFERHPDVASVTDYGHGPAIPVAVQAVLLQHCVAPDQSRKPEGAIDTEVGSEQACHPCPAALRVLDHVDQAQGAGQEAADRVVAQRDDALLQSPEIHCLICADTAAERMSCRLPAPP